MGDITVATATNAFEFATMQRVPNTELFPTPLPAAFPLFATGLGVIGLLAGRRKRKIAAA